VSHPTQSSAKKTSSQTILGGRPLICTTLESGLRVVACKSDSAPVVALQVWVGVGSADETEAQGGLAHVHEHMLFKGTLEGGPFKGGAVRRAVGEIAAEIERSGGEINAWTSYDQTVYHVVLAKQFFDTGLDVLADAIQRSAFDPDELSRELEVILEEIKRSEDQPGSRASRALFETAFTAHPYRRPVIGYSHVVRGFTREDVLAFFDAHYRADRMTVVAVGDIEPEVAVQKIAAAFAGAPRGAAPIPPRALEPAQTGIRARGLVDDVEESHLALGFAGPRLLDEDMPAVDVLSVLLGQGESSRLVSRVKRDRQLVNETYCYAYTPKDPGLVVVGSSLHHDKLGEALQALGQEVRKVIETRPRHSEVDKAKAMLASEAVYQRETVEGLARRIGTWTLLTDEPAYEARYQELVAAVTPDDVRRAAEKYLAAERANVVALVPRARAELVDEARLREQATQALAPSTRRARTTATDDVVRVELPFGARVIVERDPHNPIVTVRAAWLGGLRGETDETAGFTNLCADLVSKGTERTSASTLAETIDAMAGHMDGFAGRNSFGMRATFLKEHVDRGLALFFESMRDAAFAPQELDRTRSLVLEEMRNKLDNPAGLAFDLFNRSLWLEHPYRRDVLGTAGSVKAATSEELRRFWRHRALPAQVVLSFVGDVDADDVIDAVSDLLGVPGEALERAAPPSPGTEPLPDAPRAARLTRARAQAHLVTGVRGLSLADDDRFALEVLSSALSGQGGRLFLELRDKQSLCYSVSAFSTKGIEPGSFAVYMGTSPDKVDRALAGIDALLADVMDRGLTAAELERSKRYLIGSHEIGLQRLGARGSAMVLNELYGLGHLAHRRYGQRIEAVQLDDVLRVAQRVLSGARVTAVVGPEGSGGPQATLDPPG
jgi:zinc protease